MNLRPLDEIGHYGTAWTITDLFGFTRRGLAVCLGVYWTVTGSWSTVGGRFLAAGRICPHPSALPSGCSVRATNFRMASAAR